MELEFDRDVIRGYQVLAEGTVCQEETLETIVPDACPDILRIVDTEAAVFLSRKEAMEGRAELTGSVKAWVLYLPDGEEGMRRVEVTIPFTCTADNAALTPGCRVVAVPRVQGADTRSINPRKVLTRVNLALCVRAYAPVTDTLCAGLEAPEGAGLEQLTRDMTTCVVACVEEKPFTFSDELNLSGGRSEARELLKCRTSLVCGESKIIGNKLIFKGESLLQLLYRGEDNSLCTADYTLPFSQIMEVSGAGEEACCQLEIVPTEVSCTLLPGDGRTISVNLGFLAQAVVREERSVTLLADLYSTAYQLEVERRSCQINRLLEHSVKSQSVREIVESGTLARSVLDTYLSVGQILQAREGERLTLTADVGVTILYQEEEGTTAAVHRQFPVSCQLELPEDSRCICLCRCPEPVLATPTAGGVEVRFPLEFWYTALTQATVSGVSGVHLDEEKPRNSETAPSVVLRTVGTGEQLWDIAKAYGTTRQDIMQANSLEEESLPAGQLLLIPRRR